MTMARSEQPSFKFCTNCGRQLSGERAVVAANPVVKFCSECGFQLDTNGTCPNPDCPYHEKIPPMA